MIKAALRTVFLATALAAPAGLALAQGGQLVYFGERLNAPDGAIFGARLDPATGALSPLGPQAKVDRPTWVLPSPHRAVLYAVSETGNDGTSQGGVLSFSADPASGALTPLSKVPSGGGGATFLALDPQSHAILAANYGTGHVALIPIERGGRLDPPASVVQDSGSGPHRRQKSAHAHGIAVAPGGKFVLVSDLGADKIFVYRLDAKAMTLAPAPTPFVQAKAGSGPRHVVLSRDGRFAYVNSELTSELTVYAWDGQHGALTPLQTMSTRRPDYTGENGAGELLVSRDGRYLYASNRGEDTMVVYALDQASGLPREIQRIASGGLTPWALSFDLTERWLLVANEGSGLVTVFAHDGQSGRLTPTGNTLAVPHASAIAVLPQGPAPAPAPAPALAAADADADADAASGGPISGSAAGLLPLPPGVGFPEGTAYDATRDAVYAGSAETGALARIPAGGGAAEVIVPAGQIAPPASPFPAMLGMKLDTQRHLWIAGGTTGLVTQVDPDRGTVLWQAKVPTTPRSLLNDLVVIGHHAYVTDTFTPVLWRVDDRGHIERWLDLDKTPIRFADGPNLNGIARTADGRSLIVVQMNKGLLFRIDIATRKVTPIRVPGAELAGSDGLLLDGRTLTVVRQWDGEVLRIALDPALRTGKVVARLRDPAFVYPATVTQRGASLIFANSQFNRHDSGSQTDAQGLLSIPLARIRGAE